MFEIIWNSGIDRSGFEVHMLKHLTRWLADYSSFVVSHIRNTTQIGLSPVQTNIADIKMFRFYGCLEECIAPSKRKHIKQVFETTIQIGKGLPKRLSNRLTPNAQPLDVILVATKIHIIGAKAGRACKKNTRNPMDMGLPLEITNGVKGVGFGLYLSLPSAI